MFPLNMPAWSLDPAVLCIAAILSIVEMIAKSLGAAKFNARSLQNHGHDGRKSSSADRDVVGGSSVVEGWGRGGSGASSAGSTGDTIRSQWRRRRGTRDGLRRRRVGGCDRVGGVVGAHSGGRKGNGSDGETHVDV